MQNAAQTESMIQIILTVATLVASMYAAYQSELVKRRLAENASDLREWARKEFQTKEFCNYREQRDKQNKEDSQWPH